MAMLIHSIEMYPSKLVDAVPAAADYVQMQITGRPKTTHSQISDPDCLAAFQSKTVLNAVINAIEMTGSMINKFDPPILYPKAHIYCSLNTNGMATAFAGHFRLGYTLEKVSREDFISALVE